MKVVQLMLTISNCIKISYEGRQEVTDDLETKTSTRGFVLSSGNLNNIFFESELLIEEVKKEIWVNLDST